MAYYIDSYYVSLKHEKPQLTVHAANGSSRTFNIRSVVNRPAVLDILFDTEEELKYAYWLLAEIDLDPFIESDANFWKHITEITETQKRLLVEL